MTLMKKTILYVEDNPRNLRLVGKILNHAGYEFIEAIDGNSGLKVAATLRPDLILMDVNLPDIDGLEVTGRLKAIPELRRIPIVALTANAMYGDRERCLEAGCDGYLAKPVLREILLQTVREFLGELSLEAYPY
jgi:two-component system, cell cycle response regulator DivK